MSSFAIEINDLSKKYVIGHQENHYYDTFRDMLTNKIKNFYKKKYATSREEFWALKNISFDINYGDQVGIIGRNGAGKSTLLKILSRITEPTKGRVKICGRVSSLLEVGTGFHPELTGRENIYLNGAILGMSKIEIKKKFDEIVAFSEIEKFLDTPVKRYSSGMYVRLAFAVAAHLEPEILILDEVLAVGDVQFQKKCLGKMSEANREGRTVLFVSHNMDAIQHFCKKILLIESGEIKEYSHDVSGCIKKYLSCTSNGSLATVWINKSGKEYSNNWFLPLKMYICDSLGIAKDASLKNDGDNYIQIEGEIKEKSSSLSVGYSLYNEDGDIVYMSCQTDSDVDQWPTLDYGTVKIRSKIPERFLNEGNYNVSLVVALHCQKYIIAPGCGPTISIVIQGGLSDSPYWITKREGIVAPVISWKNIN